ncbi:BCD family MFS transporter [Aestuariicoccus sp. MJ-SS9]|uniref:BCD family MFS transporter n=1 Tax=Aestuariicoccus sp. MJ-SS9 TaxID=3079855 RepID=UPI00290EC5E5|nr:BCD family MFS transporter [Aestuariicoccus sp. MJ-SS9]MDU8910949.1 BCD family MFS transporter [Aestuariicoccus sp. MJ-SS9]
MTLGWLSIVRLGLVQMALGAIVVLTTSTLNRLMVVELALPALLPGLLVGLHYGIQITRPNWGFLSDTGGNRTRWIHRGMAVLALGGFLAACGVVALEQSRIWGIALSVLAYAMIGLGAGAAGTSVLALLATATAPHRRAAAATITWLMMIFGIAMTAGVVGAFLDPYSPAVLLRVVGIVASGALALALVATWRIEHGIIATPEPEPVPFREGLAEVWREPAARVFTIFVFLSMTAYFMQELILEPYAGLVFGFSPGESTQLSGMQNGGVFIGMLVVGIAATGLRFGSLRNWVVIGCLGSALCLVAIASLGGTGSKMALSAATVSLGFFNGVFAVAAIGSMMALAGQGREKREGTRMGLWGAAQAIAAGFGGLLGAGAVDLMRTALPDAPAFGTVFLAEAALFLTAAYMAARIMDGRPATSPDLVPGE